MRRSRAYLCSVVLALCLSPSAAAACSCVVSGPPCQAFWKTDAVFDAVVTSIEPVEASESLPDGRDYRVGRLLVHLDVRQAWKGGVAAGPLTVVTDAQESACGYPFRQGVRYLIFAYRNQYDGRLNVSLCSATRAYSGTGDAAQFLASLAEPSSGGRIFGSVKSYARVFVGEAEASPLETTVRLLGDGKERTVRSAGGQYEFSMLPPASYEIQVVVPQGHTTYSPSRTVQLTDAHACAQESFSISPAGAIAGRVVDREGRPIARVDVELTDVGAQPGQYGLSKISQTSDSDGYFTFRDLAPGKYVIGLDLDDLPSAYRPYPRTVFPSNDSPRTVSVALGEVVDIGEWRIPSPVAVIHLTGVVTWADGTPAAGVHVSLWDVTGDPVSGARGAGGTDTDNDGRFVIEAREGRTYRFLARDKTNQPLRVSAPQMTMSGALAPVRLVVSR